jgi:primosomal protein N''
MERSKALYAEVILPIKIGIDISYIVPEMVRDRVSVGTPVRVSFSNKEYIAIISKLSESAPDYKGKIAEIIDIEELPPVSDKSLRFWNWMAEYYMCSIGEVYRAAYQVKFNKIASPKHREKRFPNCKPELSKPQRETASSIEESHKKGVTALLKGVTGSGKTEIYLYFALKEIEKGNSVLFMVPEIALSRQLSQRLEKFLGERLFVYHSKQKSSEKSLLYKKLRENSEPVVVLGLRSALFLPFENLGLIIIDEEHDASYKQSEPAPRYHGRDSALMLATIYSAKVILGSATPSLESYYNTITGRYSLVELNERYYGTEMPIVQIVDTNREERLGRMLWPISHIVKNAIEDALSKNEQVLIFRNRRSYSPILQCIYCGDIPSCEHCNVPLSYHKGRGIQSCHYCGYSRRFNTICTSCGKPGLKERGCGTEMIEEWLKENFQNAKVARFDAETTSSKTEESRIIKEFARHETDILVGTQMISKGFDFENLSLVVLVQADSMLAIEDFRAGERAIQLMVQLAGRSGRKFGQGKIIIQTAQPNNPVYKYFIGNNDFILPELKERREFCYPPFIRLIKVVIRDSNADRALESANTIAEKLPEWGVAEFDGPSPPPIDRVNDKHIVNIWIKLPKNTETRRLKTNLYEKITRMKRELKIGSDIYFIADP